MESTSPLTTGSAAGLAKQRHTDFHRSRTVVEPTSTDVGFLHVRRCTIATKGAGLHSKEDEAQAITFDQVEDQVPGQRLDWSVVRNGEVTETGHISVPDEYYTAAAGSAIECLYDVRNSMLHEKPRIRAQHIVSLLVRDELFSSQDAPHALAVIEVELRRQIEEMYGAGRESLARNFPVQLRSLIPLIRRSIRK